MDGGAWSILYIEVCIYQFLNLPTPLSPLVNMFVFYICDSIYFVNMLICTIFCIFHK